jgi:hypothetical protein
MNIYIPCINCKHYKNCLGRKKNIKALYEGKIICLDEENIIPVNDRHKQPWFARLLSQTDNKLSGLHETDTEVKLLNEEYSKVVRSSILQLLRICEQLNQEE